MGFASGEADGGIFISYRRQETAPYAGRLRDRLIDRFSEDQVFMDVDSIKPGVDFADAIALAVGACEVLLALIGPQWITISDEEGNHRLEDPEDIVRLEIEAALKRKIRVIPILVEGARMPRSGELPPNLGKLASRQALSLRHESFQQDAARLIDALGNVVPSTHASSEYTSASQVFVPQTQSHQRPAERSTSLQDQNRDNVDNSDKRTFADRILDQLTLNAWLPGLLFIASVAVLLQFRNSRSTNIWQTVQFLAARPISAFIIFIVALAIATMVIQVFPRQAVRVLEGYWGARGLTSIARAYMIRRHLRKKRTIAKRRLRASEKAFHAAKPRILRDGVPIAIVNAFEAQASETALPPLTDEELAEFAEIDWRHWCDAWELARLDRLINDEQAYPASSRILPTKLGNVIRATEDQLVEDDDVEGFVLRRFAMVPRRVQRQHDEFRSRLELYCTLVFITMLLLVLTPIMLLGYVSLVAVAIIAASFGLLSAGSYRAAIASAGGYCATLRQMDNASRTLYGD